MGTDLQNTMISTHALNAETASLRVMVDKLARALFADDKEAAQNIQGELSKFYKDAIKDDDA